MAHAVHHRPALRWTVAAEQHQLWGSCARRNRAPLRQHVTRAEREDQGRDSELEDAFAQELRRRGMESAKGQSAEPTTAAKDPFASSTATRPRARPPPKAAQDGTGDQRQRSMDMVTEGLEGLPKRASLLLQLGGSVFLAFLPFMLAFSLLFTGVYAVFGDSFLHTGNERSRPPPYVDPIKLLSEPTVDPYVPFNR
ncbi:hypothetical protein V8C86DRAFT_2727800 [Haematococcus lacustris]